MAKKANAKSEKTAAKSPRGAPTKFRKEFILQAYTICAETGATDRQLAKIYNVSEATINNWKINEPDFLESLKKGKDLYDCKTVEECLLKRAKGFRYTETTREPGREADPQTGRAKMVITKKVSKLVVPDVTALIFWLKNRNPQRWKDIKRTEWTGGDGGPLNIKLIDSYDNRNDPA